MRAALGTVAALTLGYTLALAALGTHTPPATAPAPVSHRVQYEDGSYADGYCPRGAWCDDTFPATRHGIED